MTTVLINTFNGGITTDPRDSASYCQICKHFDNFSNKHSLVPYRGTQSANPDQSTQKIQAFLMYKDVLYGYGLTAGGFAQVYEADNVYNPTWTASTTAADSADTPTFELFIEYQGVFYGATTNRIWSYNPTTDAFVGTTGGGGISYTNICQGLVHSKIDILYLGIDNKVYYKQGANNIATALTFADNLIVTSFCEYGNYLAIACRPKYPNTTNSKVFLWDRDVTLTTTSESIDWGNNSLLAIENIDGYIIGVSTQNDLFFPKLIFSKYGGGGAIQFNEVALSSTVTSGMTYIVRGKQKLNNRMFFATNVTSYTNKVTGTVGDLNAVWSVGRNGENEPFSVNVDRLPNNDTLVFRINNFISTSGYMYFSYIALDTTTHVMSKTNFTGSLFTSSSVYHTMINPGMPPIDKIKLKQLETISLTYYPLPANSSVALEYRVDAGSWSTIFTESTASTQSTESQDAGGTPFTKGRDYEFRITSTGGAEITGLTYRYTIIPTLI